MRFRLYGKNINLSYNISKMEPITITLLVIFGIGLAGAWAWSYAYKKRWRQRMKTRDVYAAAYGETPNAM